MMTRIIAKTASLTNDGYSTLLGFADDPNNPVNYLVLSMTNEPGEQDLKLDQAGIHIDAGTLCLNGYNLVEEICETDTGVAVSLRGCLRMA